MGRAEHKDPARQDRHFLTGLRIATDALALLADREAAERRQLHHLATYQGLGNLVQNRLDQFGGLVARKTDLLIDGLAQVCPGYRPSGHPPLLLHSTNANQRIAPKPAEPRDSFTGVPVDSGADKTAREAGRERGGQY